MRRPRPSSAKFVVYFDLLTLCAESGCPVCRVLENTSRKALDAILYEQVNDPESRASLVASGGFCNWHTWMLADMQGSRLGTAIIGQHLLFEALRLLPDGSMRRRTWRDVFYAKSPATEFSAWRRGRKRCPVCRRVQRAERNCIRIMMDYFDEPEFAAAFARSGGLCVPHLCRALDAASEHRNRPALVEAHRERWTALRAELEEFIRKHDYRFASEAMGMEGDSWRRALEALVGRRGVIVTEHRASAEEFGQTTDSEPEKNV